MSFVHIFSPLFSAFIFAVASLCLKRGLTLGAGAMRTTFVVNIVFSVTMIPLWWLMPSTFDMSSLWIPALAGVAAFLGSLFQFLALRVGDVSMALPLLGSKVLCVAVLSVVLLGQSFPPLWWVAVFLSMSGVFLLGYTRGRIQLKVALNTIGLIGLSVGSFALMDVLIAAHGSRLGFGRFVAAQHIVLFLLSLGLIPFFNGPLMALPAKSFQWILAGGFLMVTQFFILNRSIAIFQDATGANILYSSRGVWSIVLVWTVGHWFTNAERDLDRIILVRRLLGSLLLITSIILVVTSSSS